MNADAREELLRLSRAFCGGGVSLLPVGSDKKPYDPLLPRDAEGKPTWKPLQETPACSEVVAGWLENPGVKGVAAICGRASKGLLIIDFDVRRFFDTWKAAVGDMLDGLPIQQTGGGFQVAMRCQEPGPNQKLAWMPDESQETGRSIAIETRGEGGYAVFPGSLHPSGRFYRAIAGDFSEIPMVDQSRVDFMLDAARRLCEAPLTKQQIEKVRALKPKQRPMEPGAVSVIDEWNKQVPIRQMLERAGYSRFGNRYTRPGKDASPGGVVILDDVRSYHHSTNDLLNDGHAHDPFSVFCEAEHNGDVKAAVKAAAAELGIQNSIRPPIESKGGRIELKPVPASQLGDGEAVDWVWHGYLARGHISLLIGLWKAGKTTLLAHVFKCMAEGGDLAGTIHPAKVLVITEEGAGHWARRRDDLGIADHVHFLVRPFKARPQRPEWQAFLADVSGLVSQNGYSVVIIDTFAAVNPARDENDAADMMAALMPLLQICEAGAAVMISHHPRKGDANEGQACRGSGAMPGFVDCIMEFRRFDASQPEDRRRVLTALSRFEETPQEIVIDLTDRGYVTVGRKADATRSDRSEVIQQVLAENCEGVTAAQIREHWPSNGVPKPGKSSLSSDLQAGMGTKWERSGTGTKGDPFLWFPFVHGQGGIAGRIESGREVTDL